MFNFKKYNDYELSYLYNMHSEEALTILLSKYSELINIKLCAFRVKNYEFDDFKQECMLSLLYAINTFSEAFNKTFYRYAELIIDRKIIKLLRKEVYQTKRLVRYSDFEVVDSNIDIEKTNFNRMILQEVLDVKLFGMKENILREIFLSGISIEEFSRRYNVDKKEVYNHIYLLRSILKKKVL